jgi:hypothetical protein
MQVMLLAKDAVINTKVLFHVIGKGYIPQECLDFILMIFMKVILIKKLKSVSPLFCKIDEGGYKKKSGRFLINRLHEFLVKDYKKTRNEKNICCSSEMPQDILSAFYYLKLSRY